MRKLLIALIAGFLVACTPSPYGKKLGYNDSGDFTITLYSNKCDMEDAVKAVPESQRAIVEKKETKEKIEGCWVIRNDTVWFIFKNGGKGHMEPDIFTWYK